MKKYTIKSEGKIYSVTAKDSKSALEKLNNFKCKDMKIKEAPSYALFWKMLNEISIEIKKIENDDVSQISNGVKPYFARVLTLLQQTLLGALKGK